MRPFQEKKPHTGVHQLQGRRWCRRREATPFQAVTGAAGQAPPSRCRAERWVGLREGASFLTLGAIGAPRGTKGLRRQIGKRGLRLGRGRCAGTLRGEGSAGQVWPQAGLRAPSSGRPGDRRPWCLRRRRSSSQSESQFAKLRPLRKRCAGLRTKLCKKKKKRCTVTCPASSLPRGGAGGGWGHDYLPAASNPIGQ